MIRKILQQLQKDPLNAGESEMQQVFDEIEFKQKEIAEKKEKFSEEYKRGSRLSKHRFTI